MYFKFLKCRLDCNLAIPKFCSRNLVTKRKCYYSVLGLSPGATVGEIKSAYYNLSMIYHPDKNDGSAEAAEKFRSITEAYDILSNINRKKLYDKGLHNPSTSSTDTCKTKDNFKNRSSVPQYGRTPYYDFDSWTKAHYGRTFRQDQSEKARVNNLKRSEIDAKANRKIDISLMGILVVFLTLSCLLEYIYESNLDKVKETNKKR
uniref:DnaJ homolog subfamily C member 30 n=1 Tax=Nilaparvata lugens TaxID=108931 RepID=A0A8B0H642_NILLU|nr:DnaJ homolog subfamily C member 30 [Nilaparvata lugens]